MTDGIRITLHIHELCERVSLTHDEIIEIVSYGIVTPENTQSERWEFSPEAAALAARAARLRRDLDINWPGVALAIELLEELEALRRENQTLRHRLSRFEE